MKNYKTFYLIIALAAIFTGVTFTGCGSSKQTAQQVNTPKVTQSDEASDIPCWAPDTEDWYTGTASRRSSVNRTNTMATACLRAARQNLQQKIKGSLKQVTRDYFDQMDINEGSDEASHIESASDYVVNQFMSDMMETCRKQTQPDAQGMVTMYIGVKISKKEVIDNLVQGLSNDQKLKLRFDEQKFRDNAFKVFKNDRQDSYDDYKNANGQ